MRPLTDATPKPLLQVQGQPLMQWPMQALAKAGFTRQLLNTAWLGESISAHFGEQVRWPDLPAVDLSYSHEGRDFGRALETAGGIVRALPRLDELFWVLAGDVFAPDFVFAPQALQRLASSACTAHLWLVPNPLHNPAGDFGLSAAGQVLNLPPGDAGRRYTFSTIAVYKQAFFNPAATGIAAGNPEGMAAPLGPLLRAAMDKGLVSGEVYTGRWTDVGTPERLAQLNAEGA